ncbi:MAG: hypothetical protein QXR42_05570 [Candidatus Bathyarchaeia archaeon]
MAIIRSRLFVAFPPTMHYHIVRNEDQLESNRPKEEVFENKQKTIKNAKTYAMIDAKSEYTTNRCHNKENIHKT